MNFMKLGILILAAVAVVIVSIFFHENRLAGTELEIQGWSSDQQLGDLVRNLKIEQDIEFVFAEKELEKLEPVKKSLNIREKTKIRLDMLTTRFEFYYPVKCGISKEKGRIHIIFNRENRTK